MKRSCYLLILVMLISSCMVNIVFAQGARRDAGGDAAAAKAQYLLRQIAAERDGLQQENAGLMIEVEAQEEEIEKLKAQVKKLTRKVKSSDKSLEMFKQTDTALRDRITQQKEKMNEIIVKYKELVATLRGVEGERNQLIVNKANLEGELKTCATHNINLYESGLEILDKYENKGVWSSFMQKDVVTGLKTVEIENTVENYRHMLRDEKYISSYKSE